MIFLSLPALRSGFSIWIFLLFIFLAGWSRLATASVSHNILIDPGHGGRDVGAHVGDFKESEVVWKWALALKRDLIEKGFQVALTRNETGAISRIDRIQKAQASQFDFIISLHANYLLDPRVRGIEYFILNPLSWDDQKLEWAHEETERAQTLRLKSAQASNRLRSARASSHLKSSEAPGHSVESFSQQAQVATIVEDLKKQARMKKSLKMAKILQQEWKGRLKQGSFEILSHAQSPAILIELGFLSSPVDQKNLVDPGFINHHSSLLARAIHRYFQNSSTSKLNP